MSACDGAKAVKGDDIKPIDSKRGSRCPCNAFLRCSTRAPYNYKIWQERKKRSQALGEIAYNPQAPLSAEKTKEFANEFGRLLNESTHYKKNMFYKTIMNLNNESTLVMTFPEIKESDVNTYMTAQKPLIHNAGTYNDFQRSIIIRSNLVKNGLVMKSDVYRDRKGEIVFDSEKLIPYTSTFQDTEWNIDHIQAGSKGGCNRFCNAALLSRKNNSYIKKADGMGCPCVDALKEGEQGIRDKFDYSGSKKIKDCTLYNCSSFSMNKKSQKKVKNVPGNPLGTINSYRKKLCGLDNPLLGFKPNQFTLTKKEANRICKAEE